MEDGPYEIDQICRLESGRGGSVEYLGEIAMRSGKPLAFCYEAGPCGYGVFAN